MRIARLAGLGIAAVLLTAFAVHTPVETPVALERECIKADKWATANAANLPATPEALAKFSYTWRRVIVARLDNQQKRALWENYLSSVDRSLLTQPQLALMMDWEQSLPRTFSKQISIDSATTLANTFRPRIIATFGKRSVLSYETMLAQYGGVWGSTRMLLEDCNCDTGSDPGCLIPTKGCRQVVCESGTCNGCDNGVCGTDVATTTIKQD